MWKREPKERASEDGYHVSPRKRKVFILEVRVLDDVPSHGHHGLRLPGTDVVNGSPVGRLRHIAAEEGFLVPHGH